MMVKIAIVIPTFNNRPTLRAVAEKAAETGLPVVVVNDGSVDGGPETLNALAAVARVDLPVNKGKGAAILAGAQWAGKNGFTHIITVDADGQHDPADIPGFVEAIEKNPASIVIGNRRFGTAAPLSSRFGRKWSNMWVWITCGRKVGDSQSGFRGYPVSTLLEVACSGRRYDFEVEILVRSAWAKVGIVSIPISVYYSDETKKASHFDPFMDNLRITKAYTRLVIRALIPWPHKTRLGGDGDGLTSARSEERHAG
jgi:glycosyltransferase involved in cell wall biosynthesis